MALLLTNSAEGGANTVAVTTGNSGGTSGNAFDGVTIGAGSAVTASATHAAHGTLGYQIAIGATLNANYVTWTPTSIGTFPATIHGAIYYWSAITPGSSLRLLRFMAGTTLVSTLKINSGGATLQFETGTTGVGVASSVLTASQWDRIEFTVTPGASASASADWYAGDSVVSSGSTSVSGVAWSGIDSVWIGNTGANFTINSSFWIDDLNLNDTGRPGPGPYSAAAVSIPAPGLRRFPLGV